MEILEKAVRLTMSSEVEIEGWVLSREEAVIWNNIAIILEEEGERATAINILERLKKSYEQNLVKILNNKKEYMMILYNLSSYLGREGEFERATEIIEKCIELNLYLEQASYLVGNLYNKVWIKEKVIDENMVEKIKKSCITYLKQDFFIADIMKHTSFKRHINNHCKETYKVSLINNI